MQMREYLLYRGISWDVSEDLLPYLKLLWVEKYGTKPFFFLPPDDKTNNNIGRLKSH